VPWPALNALDSNRSQPEASTFCSGVRQRERALPPAAMARLGNSEAIFLNLPRRDPHDVDRCRSRRLGASRLWGLGAFGRFLFAAKLANVRDAERLGAHHQAGRSRGLSRGP
jgi:hypothetical protein